MQLILLQMVQCLALKMVHRKVLQMVHCLVSNLVHRMVVQMMVHWLAWSSVHLMISERALLGNASAVVVLLGSADCATVIVADDGAATDDILLGIESCFLFV